MIYKLVYLSIFATFYALSGGGAAASPDVKCVQNQLAELGHYRGRIDGLIGPQTRGAVARYQAVGMPDAASEVPVFRSKLTLNNAIVLCRDLGLLAYRMRLHWPGLRHKFEFHASGDIPEGLQTDIRAAVREGSRSYSKLQIAGKSVVLIGRDYDQLLTLMRQKTGVRLASQPSDFIENACRNTKDIYAFTVRQVILFCVGDQKKPLTDRERIRLRYVAGHEYMHVIQAQFLGYPLGGNARLHTARSGPLWLMEGSAQYFPSAFTFNRMPFRDFVAKYRGKLPAELPDLADYETPQALKDDPEGVYKLGFLATRLLVHIASDQNIYLFYQRIGRGADWQQAFADSFGVTVAEFYETFRAL